MLRRFLAAAIAFAAMATTGTLAAAKLSSKPQGTEVAFVAGVQKDLTARFATPAEAEKAGYIRFTNEDDTGSISYTNLTWNSPDPQHPCQLWYSVKGQLLGADYCVPAAHQAKAPSLWGVNPQRWQIFGAHVHYIYADAMGTLVYGHATSVKKFTAAGGNLEDPKPATIAKMGLVKSAAQVKRVFLFPHLWDLEVWVLPNPNGAFADKNPNVKPSKNASTMGM